MSVSINISEELYDQARVIAGGQNIAVEDLFASAFADYLATWQRIQERAARGDREKFVAVSRPRAGYRGGRPRPAVVQQRRLRPSLKPQPPFQINRTQIQTQQAIRRSGQPGQPQQETGPVNPPRCCDNARHQ